MEKAKTLKLTALTLVIVGVVALTLVAREIIKRNTPVDFSQTNTQIYAPEGQNYPVLIEFHELGLALPVSPKSITEGKWADPEATVGYWEDSPLPGDAGNSVMYGHNWPNMLAKLSKAEKGQTITVTLGDGTKREFVVESTSTVSADQTHILENTPDTRLTVYTCTGFLDSKRFVVVAVPKL